MQVMIRSQSKYMRMFRIFDKAEPNTESVNLVVYKLRIVQVLKLQL